MPDATELWEAAQECKRLKVLGPWGVVSDKHGKGYERPGKPMYFPAEITTVTDIIRQDRALLAEGRYIALPVLENCSTCKFSRGTNCPGYRQEAGASIPNRSTPAWKWDYRKSKARRFGNATWEHNDNCPSHEFKTLEQILETE